MSFPKSRSWKTFLMRRSRPWTQSSRRPPSPTSLAIARGGLSTEYLFLTCFADYAANEYLLGAGLSTLTLAYDRMGEAHSYELYRRDHDAGQFGSEQLLAGAIPSELEGLSNLTILQLSGNSFLGCIPSGLRDVENNDLDLLGLAYCTSSES